MAVPVAELIALYAGEPDPASEYGEYLSGPHPTVPLAVAICAVERPETVQVVMKGGGSL